MTIHNAHGSQRGARSQTSHQERQGLYCSVWKHQSTPSRRGEGNQSWIFSPECLGLYRIVYQRLQHSRIWTRPRVMEASTADLSASSSRSSQDRLLTKQSIHNDIKHHKSAQNKKKETQYSTLSNSTDDRNPLSKIPINHYPLSTIRQELQGYGQHTSDKTCRSQLVNEATVTKYIKSCTAVKLNEILLLPRVNGFMGLLRYGN